MANLTAYKLDSIDEQAGRLLLSTRLQGKTVVTALVDGKPRGAAPVSRGKVFIVLNGPLNPPYSLSFQIPDPVIPLRAVPAVVVAAKPTKA